MVYHGAPAAGQRICGTNASTAGRSADAEAVLKLRALLANGDFDRYWTYHLGQEHQRNHQARYQLSAYG
ncbi:hypothetical protein [Actinophytocola sp.]|uniref:hypothetical protein n=1 Tax=Actinophytocola sp. TaxID=1872138 RepID=UPI002ED193D7